MNMGPLYDHVEGDPEWVTNKIGNIRKKLPHMMVDSTLPKYQRKEM
jgi:hypothetical protein